MVINDLLCRVGRTARILGLFVISVFYSVQVLAYLGLQTGVVPEIELKNPNDTIEYYFSINITDPYQLRPQFRVSFSDTYQYIPQWPPSERLIIKTLTDNKFTGGSLVNDKQITSQNGKNFFTLGKWSSYRSATFPYLVIFKVKFSHNALLEWINKSGKNTLDFFVVVHARYEHWPGHWRHWTSSLKVKIPIKQADHAHISGLKDEIVLPQTVEERFCVSSNTEKVRLEFEATNSTSAFQLKASNNSSNAYTIGYNITLGGTKNGKPSNITLQRPGAQESHKWDAHKAALSDIACNGDDNMWISIDFKDKNQADAAPAGEYKDTIRITVSAV